MRRAPYDHLLARGDLGELNLDSESAALKPRNRSFTGRKVHSKLLI